MDNLSELSSLLSPILNDPQAMSGLLEAAERMGLSGLIPDAKPEKPRDDGERPKPPGGAGSPLLPPELLAVFGKLTPALGEMSRDDDTTRLLAALKPFLSAERVKKLDDVERLLKLTRLINIIKESKLM